MNLGKPISRSIDISESRSIDISNWACPGIPKIGNKLLSILSIKKCVPNNEDIRLLNHDVGDRFRIYSTIDGNQEMEAPLFSNPSEFFHFL